jgi:hypothetical protein
VEVSADGLVGLDVDNFDFDNDLLESITTLSKAFLEFLDGYWDDILHADFVEQVQTLHPNLQPFLVFAQPLKNGKARVEQVEMLHRLKRVCGRERITIGGFATDGDSGYDSLHENQLHLNLVFCVKNPLEMPHKRGRQSISDVLHLLKRAPYRMLKNPPMAIVLDVTSPELNLGRFIDLLGKDLHIQKCVIVSLEKLWNLLFGRSHADH